MGWEGDVWEKKNGDHAECAAVPALTRSAVHDRGACYERIRKWNVTLAICHVNQWFGVSRLLYGCCFEHLLCVMCLGAACWKQQPPPLLRWYVAESALPYFQVFFSCKIA